MKYLLLALFIVVTFSNSQSMKFAVRFATADSAIIYPQAFTAHAIKKLWNDYKSYNNAEIEREIRKQLPKYGLTRSDVARLDHADSVTVYSMTTKIYIYPLRLFGVVKKQPSFEGFIKYLERK